MERSGETLDGYSMEATSIQTPSHFPSRSDLSGPLKTTSTWLTMITDNDLHRLAVFLGSCAMMMIVLYHFLEVNAKEDEDATTPVKNSNGPTDAHTPATATAGGSSVVNGGKNR
ncbi:Oligosaccaryltransferase-domain-containing protein [Aspergillus similis]